MDYLKQYAKFLRRFLAAQQPLTVVFDCSNGSVGPVLRALFRDPRRLRAIFINDQPDGEFPGHGPNPMEPHASRDIVRAIRARRADLGVLFDADGDRAFFFDRRGRAIAPDIIAALLAKGTRGAILLEVRFGSVAAHLLRGRRIIRTPVGGTTIKPRMRRLGAALAAEYSGHYYFRDFFFSESGILAAIKVINRISRFRDFEAWVDALPRVYRSPEINFKVKNKRAALSRVAAAFHKTSRRISRIDGITAEFPDGSWFNLRPSNTENLLRLNAEARTKSLVRYRTRKIKKLLR